MSSATALPSPEPAQTPDTEQFWMGGDDRLRTTYCLDCAEYAWYPRQACPHCHSTRTELRVVSGDAAIYSFTVVRKAAPAFTDAVPYVLAYVTLAEGPTVLTNLVDCNLDTLAIGQPVRAVAHRTEAGAAIPRFTTTEG